MATTEDTDARVLAAAFASSAVVLPVVGLAAVRDDSFELTASTVVPVLLAAAGFLLIMLVVDPVLSPKRRPNRHQVHVWLSKSFMARLPVIELPVLAALLIAVVEREHAVLYFGALSTLVLVAVWWPGEQFFGVMRRRLQPLDADILVDDLLRSSNGRLLLKTR